MVINNLKKEPDRNIFSINLELISAFLLYRGLVLHHHRILNKYIYESEELYYKEDVAIAPSVCYCIHQINFLKPNFGYYEYSLRNFLELKTMPDLRGGT